MKKIKKVILVLAIIFASLSFIALFVPFFVNLNHFKPKIQELVAQKFNAKIDFSSARLNIIGGLGIKLNDVSLESTIKPFEGEKIFSADSAEVEFELFPLFTRKLVGTVYLDTPSLNIVKIGKKDNISYFEKSSSTPTQVTNINDSSDFTFILKEVIVNHANLLFKDLTIQSAPTIVNLKDINLEMTRDNEILNLNKLTMTMFSGQLTSHMKIDFTDPEIAYTGDCDLKNFSLADVYRSFGAQKKKSPLNGQANLSVKFNGRGTTKDVYSKALNATGNFKIKTGSLKIDTALPVIIDQLGQFLTSLPIPGFNIGISREDLKNAGDAENTTIVLDNMKGNFEIKSGVLFLKNDIPMTQGLLKMDVKIGLFTSSLKGKAVFEATDAFTKNLVAKNKNFVFLLDKDNRFYLNTTFSGTVSDPEVKVDTSNILANILKRTGKSLIETIPNILQKVFGQ